MITFTGFKMKLNHEGHCEFMKGILVGIDVFHYFDLGSCTLILPDLVTSPFALPQALLLLYIRVLQNTLFCSDCMSTTLYDWLTFFVIVIIVSVSIYLTVSPSF